MNRKQRRQFAKKVNNIDNSTFKRRIFQTILTLSSTENEKVLDMQGIFAERLQNIFCPRSLKMLGICNPLINIDMNFTDSLFYVLGLLNKFHYEIFEYIRLKEAYEKALFSCDYIQAEVIIEEIQEKLGISLWTCGQMFILAERNNGLEGNKKLLSKYLEETPKNMIVNTLLEFLSCRAEESTSLNNYNEKVDKFIKNFEEDKVIHNYFSYKLCLQNIDYTDGMRIALQVDSQFSIIDMYNSFIEILQRAIINQVELEEIIYDNLRVLNEKLYDYRIENLLMFGSKDIRLKFNKEVLQIIELYTAQNYEQAIEGLSNYLLNNQNDFQMWILYIKCHILAKKRLTNKNDVICDLYSVYALDNNCIVAKGRLMYALKKYSDTTWRYKLLGLLTRKLACSNKNNEKMKLSLLNEHTITPRFVSLLPNKENNHVSFDEVSMIIPKTLKTLLPKYNYCEKEEDNYRDKLYRAEYLGRRGEYEAALECLASIKKDEIGGILYIQEKIIRLKYLILYSSGRYEEAISIIVMYYFKNENLIRRCDLKLLYEKLKRMRNRDVLKKFDYPIFVYLFDKLNTKNHRIAFSNYLDSNNISNSEELISRITENCKSIFFFEKVCTQNVLKREVRLSKTAADASKIRINILQKLIDINPKKQKGYLDEISMIMTKKEINHRIRQVSQRKIYVDEEKIKQEKLDIFMENFQKYLLIKSFNTDIGGFDVTDAININSIKQIVNSMNEDIKRSTQYSQTILALKDLVTDITFEFLRNEHYGLDTYLSSRIRHGYCKSQLTKELREYHLMLTTSDDESPMYDVSQYWDNKIEEEQEVDYSTLKAILSAFTHDIENKIHEIKKEWIRIKLNSEEIGMFDYTSFVSNILVVDKDNIVDFDFMYSTIISALWEFTNKFLEKIRERILTELKAFYYEKLADLEKEVRILEDSSIKNIVQELNGNITLCRAKIANVMTEFANIFYKDDVLYEDYSFNDLVTTCIGIEKQIHAEFENVDLETNICGDKKLLGSSFSYFVEIIIMLLNNAVTHAGYVDLSKLQLSLQICMNKDDPSTIEIVEALATDTRKWSVDNLLIITVKNNLSSEKNVDLIRTKVADIFEHAKDPQMLKQYSMTEGGSGLYKIYKTINYNMSVPYVILYSVEENEFSLDLAVDATKLLVKEE